MDHRYCPICGLPIDANNNNSHVHCQTPGQTMINQPFDHSTLADRVTALEVEVKRLASRKVCPKCGGSGELTDTHYVTRDMAIDAGDRSMEGMPIEDSYPCEDCNGTGYTEDKC